MITVVVTCCDDDLDLVPRALASIGWQLAPDDELIVVGDGVPTLGLERLELLCLPEGVTASTLGSDSRKGVSAARNAGFRKAQNPWVKYLDADDLLAPHALEMLRLKVLPIVPDRVQLISGGQHVTQNGEYKGYRVAGQDAIKALGDRNPMVVSHCLIRKTALEQLGGFDERIHFEEDWDLWLRMAAQYGVPGFGLIGQPVCYYTIDDRRRAARETTRDHTICGLDVREYFRRTYGIEALG